VRERYYQLKQEFSKIAVLERVQLALERAVLEKQFEKKTTGSFMGFDTLDDSLRKKIDTYIKRNFDPIRIYKALFASKQFKIPEDIKKFTRSLLTRKNLATLYSIEDLAPLVYIYFWLNGLEEHMKEYIVADEAQDMSPMQLLTLLMTAKHNNLFTAGDLAQSINPPFYIKSWEELQDMFAREIPGIQFSYHQINKCYRTTIEIIEFANKVLTKQFHGKYKLPEAVLRHGEKVETLRLKTELATAKKADALEILKSVEKQFAKGSATVALVCRDEAHATEVYEVLNRYGKKMDFRIINSDENNYDTGLLILPIHRAKGLEFDSVYLVDVNENRYKETELDARLLYVGLTRALHRLFIVTSQSVPDSKLLNE
jgi:DNA helicase-2/ATP-dependent DNA helicase PcrA